MEGALGVPRRRTQARTSGTQTQTDGRTKVLISHAVEGTEQHTRRREKKRQPPGEPFAARTVTSDRESTEELACEFIS